MENRSYWTVEEIEGSFDKMVLSMRRRGQVMLPGERELSRLLGCCRSTVRKLLEQKLDAGVIVRKARGRALSQDTVTGKRTLGRVTFVAKGNVMVDNPAWNRLWHRFQPKAEAAGIVATTALLPFHRDNFDWDTFATSLTDVLVITTVTGEDRLRLLERNNRLVITTEEHFEDEIPNLVAMGNYTAGTMAAEELARHGYRRPAYLTDLRQDDGRIYVPYQRRLDGFRDACRGLGLEYGPESEFFLEWCNRARTCLDIARQTVVAARAGFDALFLYTDVDVEFLMEGLRDAEMEAPRDLGVITVNSFDRAESHHPKISSISHGTEAMADTLVEKLKYFFKTGKTDIGKCLLRPNIHPGKTLKQAEGP